MLPNLAAFSIATLMLLNTSFARSDILLGCNLLHTLGKYQEAFVQCQNEFGKGNPFAAEILSAMYKNGHGVNRSNDEADKWERAAKKRRIELLSDANSAFQSDDYQKAEQLFRPLAEHGDALAQGMLGWMSLNGKGVPQNYEEALKWYRMASEQGNVMAQSDLATLYITGQGVPQDYKEAIKWLLLAAEQGYTAAQLKLSTVYYLGLGVPQDYVTSYMWADIVAANSSDRKLQQSAINARDNVLAMVMTGIQVVIAKELAKGCTANNFKGCQRK